MFQLSNFCAITRFKMTIMNASVLSQLKVKWNSPALNNNSLLYESNFHLKQHLHHLYFKHIIGTYNINYSKEINSVVRMIYTQA